MKISRFAVNHPVVIGMLLIVLCVFGLISVTSMNIAFMSDISMPSVVVVAIYPGASAEDVEEDVTNILEDDFVTLPNFKGMTSVSQNSSCLVTITFQDGADPYEQLPEVRNRINMLLDDLPDGLSGTPNALVGGASMLPVLTFSVEGGNDTVQLTKYVNESLKPRITGIDGVADVSIEGGSDLRVDIKLNLEKLFSKGVSVTQVYQALNYGNVNLPVGSTDFENRTIDVRYSGGFKSLDDIKNLPIGYSSEKLIATSSSSNNVIIRLADVADITIGTPEKSSYVTDGETPIIVVNVTKRDDGNTVGIVKEIKKTLDESKNETSGAVSFHIINDDSRTISASMRTVISSGIAGIIMAVIVLFLFLNDIRATFIIGISIPLSILFTFVGMKLMGITINLMSLSGMVVALGMIVDGSIVMIEQIFRYLQMHDENGNRLLTVKDSIFTGSDEVGGSIFASTATTIVVFLPITAISGIVGMILKDVAWTLVLSLAASFLVAVMIVPFLISIFFRNNSSKPPKTTLFIRIVNKIQNIYRRMLYWSLKSWKFVVATSFVILILSMLSVVALGLTFIPSTDNGDFYIDLDFPNGQTLEQTDFRMRQAEAIIKERVGEIDSMVFYVGENQSTVTGGVSPNTGYIHIVLVPVSERHRDIHDIYIDLQEALSSSIPDVSIKTSNGGFDKLLGYVSSGGGYGLTLVGEDMAQLYNTALRIQDQLKTDPDVVVTSIDTSFDTNALILSMSHDYMSSLGVSSYEAGIASSILFQGVDSGKFRNTADGELYNMRLFSDVTDKPVTQSLLSNISIKSTTGQNVSFAGISDMHVEQSISRINHTDRSKTITVSATLTGEDTTGVASRINSYLEQNPLPSGIKSQPGGIMELLGDSIPPMISALLIAIFLVYTVMVLQFERFRQPLIVMITIPFCVIGVVIGLLLFGSSMSLLAFLGIIALGGVVVNNGIILIDYINLLRKDNSSQNLETDQSLAEKVVEGSASRIRPVFMTTLTTMLGVVPMALAKGEGAEIYAPLGQAISGGLLTSTLITLFIIPILYYITERRRLHKNQNKISIGENAAELNGKKKKKSSGKILSIMFPLFIGVLFLSSNSKVNAESENDIQTNTYTLSSLIKEADNNNTSLQKAALEAEQARYSVIEARSYLMPTIQAAAYGQYEQNPSTIESLVPGFIDSFNDLINGVNALGTGLTNLSKYSRLPTQDWQNISTYSPDDPSKWAAQFTGSLTQPICTWGKIMNSIALAKTGVEAKQLQKLVKQREIQTEITSKTAAIYYLLKINDSIKKQLEYGKRLETISADGLKNGMILPEEAADVTIQIMELETSQKSIQYQINSMILSIQDLTSLEDLTKESFDFSFIPNDIVKKTKERATKEQAEEYIRGSSNESELLSLRIKAAEQQRKTEAAETWGKPDIAFKLGYSFTTQSFNDEFFDNGDWNITAAIAINSTLFDGLKSYAKEKSAAVGKSLAINEMESNIMTLISKLKQLDESIEYKSLLFSYYNEKYNNSKKTAVLRHSEFSSGYGDESSWLKSEIDSELSFIALMQNNASLFADYASYQYLCGLLPADYLP